MRRLIFALLFVSLFIPLEASAYYTNMDANLVIGRPDFTSTGTSGTGNATATSLDQPQDLVVIDGKLIVADQINHRVLIWNSTPTTNGKAADVVIGQPDLVSDTARNGGASAKSLEHATGVTSNGQKLIVVDRNGHRVLVWNSIPTTNFTNADVVIGQQNFTSIAATKVVRSDRIL